MPGDGDLSRAGYPVHLVVVGDPLVAHDLADTLRDFDPGAAVLVATSCEAGLQRVEPHAALGLAFVEADPLHLAASSLGAALGARGARIVLLGAAAEDAWQSGGAAARLWPVLMRPFSSEMVLDFLRHLRGRSAPF